MAEIKTKVEKTQDESGNDVFVITNKHTIADIYRWLVDEDWLDEILTLHELESEGLLND